ncbi:MAG: protease inhibitor I42 family protein [Anaerolineales bacterium]
MKTHNFKSIKAGNLLVLLLFVVLASCDQPQGNPPKEVGIYWSKIDQGVGLEVGDILEVALPANPSTGYIWEFGFSNQSVLKPHGEPEFSSTSTNLGAEETQKLHFEAIGEGETELVLVYRRSFENDGLNQQTFQVYVVVD